MALLWPCGRGDMATIDDVARAARVSIKTVSRVLNGEPHVRPELRSRVLEAQHDLGYRPNQSARRLAGGRSSIIAYLYNNPTPSYIALIQEGAALQCRRLGTHLVVEPIELHGPERLDAIERLVSALRPDGVFLIPPLSDDADLLALLTRFALPIVRIAGTGSSPGTNIELPENAGGRMVVEHLTGLGHTRIAAIGAPESHASAARRTEGFCEAMAEAGLAIPPSYIETADLDFRSGEQAAARILSNPVRPTAIFAANDEMALGTLSAARKLGLDVPKDLSLVGFDDVPASASSWPTLTTVRQPLCRIGKRAIDLICGSSTEDGELSFELIVRQSTKPPR